MQNQDPGSELTDKCPYIQAKTWSIGKEYCYFRAKKQKVRKGVVFRVFGRDWTEDPCSWFAPRHHHPESDNEGPVKLNGPDGG